MVACFSNVSMLGFWQAATISQKFGLEGSLIADPTVSFL